MANEENNSITREGILEPKKCPDSPMELFREWYADAIRAKINMPETMVLSTVSTDNRASSRVVLLKDYDEEGFVFYTNYTSRKGMHLSVNPYCSLVLHWPDLDRQVRVEGKAERVSKAASDNYFASRPRLSQLGAWASKQSATISSRLLLVRNLKYATEQYEGEEVPRPPSWGGYLVRPEVVEFWQGQPGRLHERLCYEIQNVDRDYWSKEVLSP